MSDNISMPGFFIGDAAFPLITRIMKSYYGSNLTIAQRIFNYRALPILGQDAQLKVHFS